MNTFTKLALSVPAIALMTACANTSTPTHVVQKPAEQVTSQAYDRMMPERYSCGNAGDIMSKQSIDKSQVTLTANIPQLKFNQQSIILNQEPVATGMRYVNKANPDATFQWHMVGDDAQLLVDFTDAQAQDYKITCQKL